MHLVLDWLCEREKSNYATSWVDSQKLCVRLFTTIAFAVVISLAGGPPVHRQSEPPHHSSTEQRFKTPRRTISIFKTIAAPQTWFSNGLYHHYRLSLPVLVRFAQYSSEFPLVRLSELLCSHGTSVLEARQWVIFLFELCLIMKQKRWITTTLCDLARVFPFICKQLHFNYKATRCHCHTF